MSVELTGRRFSRGEVGADELRELAQNLRRDYLRQAMIDQIPHIPDWSGDAMVVDGDLHVPGDLDLFKEKLYLLIVKGDLLVEGYYGDYDDPQTMTLVTGSMKARDIVTAGWLDVFGDLEVSGRLVGDYNDCSAWIGGNVRCQFIHREHHGFDVGGKLIVEVDLDVVDERLLEHLDLEFLDTIEDEDDDGNDILIVDGLKNRRDMLKRVREGLPLKS